MERVMHVVRTGQYGERKIEVEPTEPPLSHEVVFYLTGSTTLEKARHLAAILNAGATRAAIERAGQGLDP